VGGHFTGSLCVKGFGRFCIYSEMCESDGDMLRNCSEEDGNVSSECEEDGGTACEDGVRDVDW
jgi:hypothetical protein